METRGLQLKAFVPSGADFAASLSFFQGLGFRVNWQMEGLAELQAGEALFLLQDFHHPEMQANFMMYLTVEHLDEWYAAVQATGLFDQFETAHLGAPQDFPWGAREVHFTDPAGVCWHVTGK